MAVQFVEVCSLHKKQQCPSVEFGICHQVFPILWIGLDVAMAGLSSSAVFKFLTTKISCFDSKRLAFKVAEITPATLSLDLSGPVKVLLVLWSEPFRLATMISGTTKTSAPVSSLNSALLPLIETFVFHGSMCRPSILSESRAPGKWSVSSSTTVLTFPLRQTAWKWPIFLHFR